MRGPVGRDVLGPDVAILRAGVGPLIATFPDGVRVGSGPAGDGAISHAATGPLIATFRERERTD